MRDPRMKEHLNLAREAGTKAMAKDFFAKPPGQGDAEPDADEAGGMPDMDADDAGGAIPPELAALSPEELQELLALLEAKQAEGGVPPEGA